MRFKVVDVTSQIQEKVVRNNDVHITKPAPVRCDESAQTTTRQREDVPSEKGEEVGVADRERKYLFFGGQVLSRRVDRFIALWLGHGGNVILLLILGVLASWVDVC